MGNPRASIKRYTYNISEDRKNILEKKAIQISVKVGKTIRWTELINFMIDNYNEQCEKEYIDRANDRKDNDNY